MLNRAPIFVNGFQRGGTNILVNLIASHPEVALLRTETHEVFYGRSSEHFRKWINRLSYLPILMVARQHVFWPYRLYDRKRLPRIMMQYVDLLLFMSKMTNAENRTLTPRGVHFSEQSSSREIAGLRPVCKNVNAVVLTTDLFAEMYPDATFIALIRDGFALCEGFMRRGWSPERFGALYERVGQKIAEDVRDRHNYHLVRFEELISNTAATIRQVYQYAGLDLERVTAFRLQAKLSMNQHGKRQYTFGGDDREVQWFPLEQVGSQFRKDVNQHQRARLSVEDQERFLSQAQHTMEYFGYV